MQMNLLFKYIHSFSASGSGMEMDGPTSTQIMNVMIQLWLNKNSDKKWRDEDFWQLTCQTCQTGGLLLMGSYHSYPTSITHYCQHLSLSIMSTTTESRPPTDHQAVRGHNFWHLSPEYSWTPTLNILHRCETPYVPPYRWRPYSPTPSPPPSQTLTTNKEPTNSEVICAC